jgi:hypothetical protein
MNFELFKLVEEESYMEYYLSTMINAEEAINVIRDLVNETIKFAPKSKDELVTLMRNLRLRTLTFVAIWNFMANIQKSNNI